MNIAAFQMARAGSKGVPGKNTMEIGGKPLYKHNIDHLRESKYINSGIYISTDCKFIMNDADVPVIERPRELCGSGPESSQVNVTKHALDWIENHIGEKIDILITVFGNAFGAYAKDVDRAIDELCGDLYWDSAMSVSEYNMYNPYRAMQISSGGELEMHESQGDLEKRKDWGRQEYGNFYFMNGSFFVTRRDNIINADGISPYKIMGTRICPIIQENVLELDETYQIDLIETLINKNANT